LLAILQAVFGLLFSIILKYVKLDDEDSEGGGGGDVREALKLWFRKRTEGYAGVDIKVPTTLSSFSVCLSLCIAVLLRFEF
jgi:hypothetical protein